MKKSDEERIVYMLRTKPKYRFPLTEEEEDELGYYVSRIYNPAIEMDFSSLQKKRAEI